MYIFRQLTILLLCGYSLARHKLTPPAVVVAFAVAQIHALPASPLPFLCLLLFFVLGTIGTRIGHKAKAHLTVSSTGGSGAEGPRGVAQVLANAGAAVILIVAARYGLIGDKALLAGVSAAYAAAAADTLGSEIGILGGEPFMITTGRKVARGTNGGVTALGLGAGAAGAVVLAAAYSLSTRDWSSAVGITVLGVLGSLVDSLLGAVTQTTVTDRKTGRVVEGENGRRVMVTVGGSRVSTGRDWLNNNGVNFAMTFSIAVLAVITLGH